MAKSDDENPDAERLNSGAPAPDPADSSLADRLRYALSLPERTVRAGSAAVAGTIREGAALLAPQAIQNSKTYTVMVKQTLDFLTEDIGGVAKPQLPATAGNENAVATPAADNFVARKSIGNFVDMASLATLHVSPLLLLATVSDIAYGSQTFLRELADELKRDGVIDEQSTIHHIEDLLAAVASATRLTAGAFDTPPLSVDGLRETIDQTREALRTIDPARVIPQSEINRVWSEMRELAKRDGVSPLAISGAMTLYTLSSMHTVARGALSGVRVAGRLFDRHVIDHYEAAIGEIRSRGVYSVLRDASGPYIDAVWQNFSAGRSTVTEDLLTGRLWARGRDALRRWRGLPDEPDTKSSEIA
jgi:hypothetical protein